MSELANDERARAIAGLRDLAQYLHDNPDVPVSQYGVSATFATGGLDGDEAAIGRVRQMATTLGVEVYHHGAVWRATRAFGGVTYGCTYVERAEMAQHDAALSYEGAVEPDGSPS